MSSHEQQQTQIMQTCQKINEMLEISQQDFSLQALTHIDWYMTVLQLIYPQLGQRFQQLKKIEDEGAAIDKLLFMLTQQEIIEEDFLQIKGQDIVQGDVQSVYYVVQLLNALIERQGQQEGDQQNPPESGQQSNQQHHQQQHDQQGNHTDGQYSNDFQEAQSSQQSPQKLQQQVQIPSQNLPKPILNDPNMFNNAFNHFESQDEPSHQEERHSVLGIQNQFEDDQDDEDQQQEKQEPSSGSGIVKGNNATFGQQNSQGNSNFNQQQSVQLSQSMKQNNYQHPSQAQYNSSNKPNIFTNPNQAPSKAKDITAATGYKMTQNPPQMKQFPSSSEQDVNFYEQPNKKRTKQSKPQNQKQETQQQDENQYFINPTIKKYKSDAKLIKNAGSGSKKSTSKKNVYKYASPKPSNQSRKLVSHPTMKKQFRKATNPQAKQLTQQVKAQASSILKKAKKAIQVSSIVNPSATEMERKKKQLKVKLSDWKKENQVRQQRKLKSHTMQTKSNLQLGKILNWRQGQLKKQKQEFQKAMEMKLSVQKENYIKKINTLLIKLQKQKQLHERQNYKQQLINENQQAAKRLGAIEQWYKDRIHMLKQKNSNSKNQRTLMHTGHKQILKQIEKQLKRQNQKQIMAMTMKYRRQQAQVENDLQQLERQIIKVYKRN